MRKKIGTVVFLSLLALAAWAYYLQNFSNNSSSTSESKIPAEVYFSILPRPLSCSLERVEINNISAVNRKVQNADTLTAWTIGLKSGEKAYFIVELEEPFKVGQSFLAAADCKPLTEELKLQAEELAKQAQCSGIYVWNKETHQIKRECGFILQDTAIFPTKK